MLTLSISLSTHVNFQLPQTTKKFGYQLMTLINIIHTDDAPVTWGVNVKNTQLLFYTSHLSTINHISVENNIRE